MLSRFKILIPLGIFVFWVDWVHSEPIKPFSVVVTIKPIYSLVCNLMKGHPSQPYLLSSGHTTDHEGKLNRQDMLALKQARLVIWLGPLFQPFLKQALPISNPVLLNIMDSPHLLRLPQRQMKGACSHFHDTFDGHVWLDPINSIAISEAIADSLISKNPSGQKLYEQNLKNLKSSLLNLHEELTQKMSYLKTRKFFTLHDTYQYLEKRYNLELQGTLFIAPGMPLSGHRFKKLFHQIQAVPQAPLFLEHPFESHSLAALFRKRGVKICILDPLGIHLLPKDSNSYIKLMRNLGNGISACLQ